MEMKSKIVNELKTVEQWSVAEDFSEIVEEVSSETREKIDTWVGKEGYDVKMNVFKDLKGDLIFNTDDSDICFKSVGSRLFHLYEKGQLRAKFKSSKRCFSTTKLGNISTADMISDGSNGYEIVVGNTDGKIKVLNCNPRLNNMTTSLKLDGHASHVTKTQFFPSGVVILSSGIDMRLKIWDAKNGSNPRTFVGHKGTVNDFSMIGRGRNFLSASSDGSIKLWDCASGTSVLSFTCKNISDGVNTLTLANYNGTCDNIISHTNEAFTEGKAVFAGHNSGMISYHDIYNRVPIFEVNPKNTSACTSLCLDSSYYLFTAFENGTLLSWDVRKKSCPVDSVLVNEYDSISKVCYSENNLYVSSGINNAFYVSLRGGCIQSDDITHLSIPYERVSDFCFEKNSSHSWCVGSNGLLLRH